MINPTRTGLYIFSLLAFDFPVFSQLDSNPVIIIYTADRHWYFQNELTSNNIYKKDRLDVGMDSAYKIFGEYKPFSYEDIKNILKF